MRQQYDCTSGAVGLLLANGDGTFQAVATYGSGGWQPFSVAVADVNGDGKADLATVNDCDSYNGCDNGGIVSVLLGNGDGTFQTGITYSSGGYSPQWVAVADVNGDNKPDLLVANCFATSGGTRDTSGILGVLINTSIGPTTTNLSSSLNPSNFGQTVTLSAAVISQGVWGTPTGKVTFTDGSASLGTSDLNGSGVAALMTSSLTVGTHNITASYSGDSNFAASTSPVLSQVVQGAILYLSTIKLSFGNQTVGIPSTAQTVTLTNTGNITLAIKSLGITGKDSGDFSQTNTCGSSVAAGASCTISVTLTPITTGARTAAVNITDNGAKGSATISLSGTGVLPTVSLSPTSLTFPTQVVFTTSKSQTVTLTNTGLGILSISTVVVTGPFVQTNTCGSTVKPAGSCTLTVIFKPTTIGAITGSITLADNAANSPQTVTLKGTGTYVQLTPTSENFGNQPVRTTSLPKKITVSNKGSVAVSITSISITGTNAGDFAQTNTCGNSVAAGASCFITVTFKPLAPGARSASVSVSDNGGGSPQKVSLAGTGT